MRKPDALDIPYSLREIYLRSSDVAIADDFDPTLANTIDGSFRVLPGKAEVKLDEVTLADGQVIEAMRCVFTASFEFRYTRHEEAGAQGQGTTAAHVKAQYVADYAYNRDIAPNEAELAEWAQRNVILHMWPYWREYCASTLGRMHLPTAIMPLLNVANKPKQSAKTRQHKQSLQPEPVKSPRKPRKSTKAE